MKKQSQNASSEAIKNAVLKGAALTVTGLTVLTAFVACNKPGQTTTPNEDPNTKPPVVDPIDPTPVDPVEKTISIDKIYNDYFSGTSFDADIQAAQTALANRVFDNLTPQIANITYNESTKELTFDINYVENGKAKSGSMSFVAPTYFQQIRGKQAKALVLEYAELIANSEIKESEVDSVKAKIEKAINGISEKITTSFVGVKTNSIAVEKEQDPIPVETISFDELIADELGEYLGNITLLQEPSKKAIQQNMPNKTIFADFKIAIENDNLIYYFNHLAGSNEKRLVIATYKGAVNEFEDLIKIATDPHALLNAYFTNSQQNNMKIELNSEEYRTILSICQTILNNVSEQSDKLSALNYKNFTNKELARHNNELSPDEALQFALKLGYSADEVLGVYVGTPSRHTFDSDELFKTGYLSFYTVSVLNIKNGQYIIDECRVVVPHYSDSQQADYYRYFLEGEKGIRFITENETSTSINGIIVDFSKENATTQDLYAKYISSEQLNGYLPLNLLLDILPR